MVYKNQVITWRSGENIELDELYDRLRELHSSRVHKLRQNYSHHHTQEVCAKSIYWGDTGEPEVVASILQRSCWPERTYRVMNRLWKPEMLTNPVFGISPGFGLLLDSQIAWCNQECAQSIFMSRQGSGSWRRWLVSRLDAAKGFSSPPGQYLTCDDVDNPHCWQQIMHSGNPAQLDNWRKQVNIKTGLHRLGENDFEDLKLIVNSKGGVRHLIVDDAAMALRYRSRWLEGMRNYYLNTESITHFMYGWYVDGTLVSCMSWRCDLPGDWSDSWVVGNLKSLPGYSVRTNGMLQIWGKMFEVCEGLGLTRWHMVIPEANSKRYQAVADRYFSEIDKTYSYDWPIVVPANTKPNEDWVWGCMGRVMLNNEIRVRTGTKIIQPI
jgi:hypothetical protein